MTAPTLSQRREHHLSMAEQLAEKAWKGEYTRFLNTSDMIALAAVHAQIAEALRDRRN